MSVGGQDGGRQHLISVSRQAEGEVDPEISQLHVQIDQAIRQKTIYQLLKSARARMAEAEYPLALQKVQEVLQLDSENAEAHALRTEIKQTISERQIEHWLRLARQYIGNHDYGHAHEALQEVLRLRSDTRALEILAEVEHLEKEYLSARVR